MKTLSVMLTAGTIYALLGELFSQVLTNTPLDGDTRFALFVIGLGLGVFASRRLGWID